MFPHTKDKNGKPLFIIKAKLSVKGAYKAEELHKVLGKLSINFSTHQLNQLLLN